MSSIMMRIGILFAVLGFGTFILEQFDMEFRLLSWADDMQPTFGIVLGLVGVALIAGSLVLNRSKAAPQAQQQPQQFAQQPPAPGAPQQYPGQAPQQQYSQNPQQNPQQPGQPGRPA
jgi:energy-converting hydrogenase Eha subunit F